MNEKILFFRTSFQFHSALVALESRIYVVVEQFGAENISLVSRRLVSHITFLRNN